MNFFWNKKYSLGESGVLQGLTDCHSHLLPGVDDGVRTFSTSLEILSQMEKAGVSELWITPHIMEDMPNSTVALQAKFEQLTTVYQGKVRLHLAAEYMLDSLFEFRLQQNDLLPHAGGRLLVETSYVCPPYNLDELLENIRRQGYTPLLAHPERYQYMEMSDYRRLKESPVHFQLNLPSLTGAYGPRVQRKAVALLGEGCYDCVGTDTHSLEGWLWAVHEKRVGKQVLQLWSKKMVGD